MKKVILTIILLLLSNVFMTFAWYGHLKIKQMEWGKNMGLLTAILISWGLAFFEYCLQVSANRIGFKGMGGPFSLIQLKVMQEIITLIVFVGFALIFFKTESFSYNHFIAFIFLILAVYFVFKK